LINLSMFIEQRQEYPCYCREAPKDPCFNLIGKDAVIGYKIHPFSKIGRSLEYQVLYHWENYTICCSKECAERVTKSWDGAKKEVIDKHLDWIRKDVDKYKEHFK